jgi:hypothetical protein
MEIGVDEVSSMVRLDGSAPWAGRRLHAVLCIFFERRVSTFIKSHERIPT